MKFPALLIAACLCPVSLLAGTHYYKGEQYFFTALNEKTLSDETVRVTFAVRPPAMFCGRSGVAQVVDSTLRYGD